MGQIANCVLGVLASGLASLAAQEKPGVPKLRVEDRTIQVQQTLILALQGEWPLGEDLLTSLERSSGTLKPRDLELTVRELERASRFDVGGNVAQGLAALDVAERAAMKVRRLLAARGESAELSRDAGEGSDVRAVALSPDGRQALVILATGDRVQVGPEKGRDPLQEAQGSLRRAVASLRQASDVDEAKAALDDLDERVTALRVLLWEKKAAKRD